MTREQDKIIRVGSRKSELALIQTKHVIARLQKLFPNKKFEIHTMSTVGDRVLNISLPKIGEKSLFTRDLEDSLRNGGVDFVVHSLKDLPTVLPVGMAIGAVLEREDARDALVLRENYKQYTLQTLPQNSVIGTSSLRRTAQIRRQYPQLIVCDIRGNLNTRLSKLDAVDSKFAGIILAQAGLERMGWNSRISQVLEPVDILYAVGQGALAVECRSNDHEVLNMLQRLMCLSTTCRILAERSFLKTLGGGCSAPVAVWSKLEGDLNDINCNQAPSLSLTGAVWSLDGAIEIRDKKLSSLMSEDDVKEEKSAERKKRDAVDFCDKGPNVPCKRARKDDSDSDSVEPDSPPVINDDANVEGLSATYNINELIAKHIALAKKCPVVGASAESEGVLHLYKSQKNNNNQDLSILQGIGDAPSQCPLPIEVGQDFMGECPFVSNEEKVTLASTGKCPLTKENDKIDHAFPTTSAKCPFSTLHAKNGAGDAVTNSAKAETSHSKCPFLAKTVQMFDYADEEKPTPKEIPNLIEDVDNLFCGLYQHACYKRELYTRSNKLGQQLAEELIKKGALDVMKCAQAEIHSKA